MIELGGVASSACKIEKMTLAAIDKWIKYNHVKKHALVPIRYKIMLKIYTLSMMI